MTRDEAHARAVELAHATGWAYGLWAMDYSDFRAIRYQKGDEREQGFIQLVTPAQAQLEEEHDG